jgi:hypothetical protein
MSEVRPIGHVAANLPMLALAIRYRVRFAPEGTIHVCWRGDDGCLYLEPASHPVARSIERVVPHQIIARYRKRPSVGWCEIQDDLERARLDFAAQSLAEAMEAVCP